MKTKSVNQELAETVADSSGAFELVYRLVLSKLTGSGDLLLVDFDTELDRLIETAESVMEARGSREERDADLGDAINDMERDAGGPWEAA